MLNLSRYANKQASRHYYDELSDRLILDGSEKIRLPRHISTLESTQHNRTINTSQHQVGQQYSLNQNTSSAEASNLVVNILRYQLQDSAAQQKHLENLRNNLQRRLETAQTEDNCQLVTMLQEEFKQLELSK